MDEKPKSIWQKSWQAWKKMHWFRRWLILTITFLFFRIAVIQFNPNWHGMTPNWLSELAVNSSLCGFAAGAFVCLWSFACWFANWRRCKRLLFFLACFATLIALFYAEEDWRGWHAWNQFKHEWEAKGEKFDFKDFVPPPVPDDQNFAMTPILVESMKAMLGPERSRPWFGDKYAENGRTNFTDRLDLNLRRENGWNDSPTNGDWASGTITDLKSWQAYFRAPVQTNRNTRITTNEFPIAPQPQSPAEDVLLALGKYNLAIEELRQASQLPYSRFPLDYDCESPPTILLPQLAAMKRCTLVLQLRAIAELHGGQSEKALADIKLGTQLTDKIHTEPFLISQLVRLAMLQIMLQPIYEGLAEHQWTDEQLVALEAMLAKLDFLADYKSAMRGELGFLNASIGSVIRNRQDLWMMFSEDGDSLIPSRLYPLIPTGWFYQNQLRCDRMMVEFYNPVADVNQQTFSPAAVQHADKTLQAETKKITPFNILERLLLPALGNAVKKFAYAQSSVDLARTAIALERYRLAHGEFPESLDALAPLFIAKVPHDVIGGGPLKYRRTADGQFVLYSIGWNEIDDGGVVITQKSRDPRDESGNNVDIYQGDWVWRYPAKAE
jgi:hypothetical protein